MARTAMRGPVDRVCAAIGKSPIAVPACADHFSAYISAIIVSISCAWALKTVAPKKHRAEKKTRMKALLARMLVAEHCRPRAAK